MEDEFKKYEEDDLWHQNYLQICNESNEYKYTNKESRKLENKHLNRYRDVTPFDHSRIKLTRGGDDYINASLIKYDKADRTYILTQGPLPHTVAHFWSMVWEQNSKAVLMLNGLIERGAIKCCQYWPNNPGGDFSDGAISEHLNQVKLKVDLISEVEKEHFIIRKCLLTDETDQKREVIQFHYTAWPDFGLPESPASFLEFLTAVQESGALEPSHGPIVVHCSAGIGRSGTFCLVDTCLVLIKKYGNSEKINVKSILLEMRKYRKGLIQTPEQLRFSYLAIIEGAKTISQNKVPTIFDKSIDIKINSVFENGISRKRVSEEQEDLDNGSQDKPTLSNNHSPSESPPMNNNPISSSDMRQRKRLERNKKTSEVIQKIKDKQKEIDERSRFKSNCLKIGCIGGVIVFSAGLVFYYLNLKSLDT